mgnify:CR=1 FL=1
MTMHDTIEDSRFIIAQCRLKSGTVGGIIVLDLSTAGCLIDRGALKFRPEQRLLMRLPGLEYIPSTVLWVEDDRVGIEFERPLHDAVLAHLTRAIRRRALAA